MKGRKETTHIEKIDFAKKLRKIDPCSGIPVFLPFSPNYDEKILVALLVVVILVSSYSWIG